MDKMLCFILDDNLMQNYFRREDLWEILTMDYCCESHRLDLERRVYTFDLSMIHK